MAIKYLLKQRRTDTLQALLIFLLLISFAACKKEQESQPAPQVPPVSTVHVGGRDYTTRTIGKHTWTTINYAGPGGVPYRSGNEKPEYGRYYTLEEARAISLPAGWRLPTIQDYTALAESQGVVFTKNRATGQEAIKKMTSTANWRTVRGTNASGFDAHPAGYSFRNGEPMDGDISEFWTADGSTFSIQERATGDAYTILFYASDSPAYRFNLRFVKDN